MRDRTPAVPGVHCIFWVALVADATLLVTDSIVAALFNGQGAWEPSWVLASAFMGKVVLHWPAVFDCAAMTAAAAALFPFYYCYTLIFALFVLPWNHRHTGFAGALFGALCYVPSLYGLTLWHPWLTQEHGWSFLIAHVASGAAAACLLACGFGEGYD